MIGYEHEGKGGGRWGWPVVLLICACLLAWAAIQYATIRDPPRKWDFGQVPDAPSESSYSTSEPAETGAVPPQLEPLPDVGGQTSSQPSAVKLKGEDGQGSRGATRGAGPHPSSATAGGDGGRP